MEGGPFSKKDMGDGKKLLDAGKVGQVLFSEGTYQVEVAGGKRGKASVNRRASWSKTAASLNRGTTKDSSIRCVPAAGGGVFTGFILFGKRPGVRCRGDLEEWARAPRQR